MPPPKVATEVKTTPGLLPYPALNMPWVVARPSVHVVDGASRITRRDVLKLSAWMSLATLVLSACGSPSASEQGGSTNTGEINIPNPEDVPGYVRSVRPWSVDLETGMVLPSSSEIIRTVANSFPRWINPQAPLIELHNEQQMVIRVPNNTGSGTELGLVSDGTAHDLKSESSTSGFSLSSWAKGEQFIRPGFNGGLLTPFMDYKMSSDSSADPNVNKLVKPSRDIGDQHLLKDENGNNFALPGNARQVGTFMKLVNYLYARVINDNIYGLDVPARFERFHQLQTQILDDILAVPTNGDTQTLTAAYNYMNSIGYVFADQAETEKSVEELQTMFADIAKVDAVSIPSARLAVSIAMGLANGEVALQNDGQSSERSEQVTALTTYVNDTLHESAIVPFSDEKAVEEAVKNEWMRIPLSKPRVYEVIVQNYKEDTVNKTPEENKGYVRKIIFVGHAGEGIVHTTENPNGTFDPLFNHAKIQTEKQDLQDQRIIDSKKKDNIFFSVEQNINGIKTGQHIVEMNEIDSSAVKLFAMPGGKMQWGVETVQNGNAPYGWYDQLSAKLGATNYQTIPYQDIVLEDGTQFTSQIEGYFNRGWATDITSRWLEWKKSGLKEVTTMGMLTPDQYLKRIADGSMFQPQSSFLRDTLLGRYAAMDVQNSGLDTLKTNNVIAALEDMPLYQINGDYATQVDVLMKGDVVTYDNSIVIANGQPMLRLFQIGGLDYAVPVDFAKVQMIDTGTRDRIIETAKTWLPIALLLIPYGKVAGKGIKSLLKLIIK